MLGLLPISLAATTTIALSSCATSNESTNDSTNNVNQTYLNEQFANFTTFNDINEYKQNVSGKYFDQTKELLVKSGYCNSDDGITSPGIVFSQNQDGDKLKVKLVFEIIREGSNELKETHDIPTNINLIKIKELPLIHALNLRPLTADNLLNLTSDKLLETLKNLDCGINNPELISESSIKLTSGKNVLPIVASRGATPLDNFKITLSLTCNENSIFMVEDQIQTLSSTYTKTVDKVKLSNEDKIAQSMWTFEDPSTKTIISGLSEFGQTQPRLIIPSNVKGIKQILSSNKTNDVVKEIQFNKGCELGNIYDQAFLGFTGLTTINLPSSIKSVGIGAFKGCSALENIKIDNNPNNDLSKLAISEISESCFEGCSVINNLKFAQDIKTPQRAAFKDCVALNSITIGENEVNDFTNCDWTVINDSVFENVGAIRIKFPLYLNSIGKRAFAKSKIEWFRLNQSSVTNENQKLKFIGDEAFYQCKNFSPLFILFVNSWNGSGFSSTCINSFGARSFAETNIQKFCNDEIYSSNVCQIVGYLDIFFSTTQIVNFGASVFENSLQIDYDNFAIAGETTTNYVTVYPNWKFNGKNTFKNTEVSLWLNTVTLNGFSWTINNFAEDCFGPLKTETNRKGLQGWNGMCTWYSANQQSSNSFDINLLSQGDKNILSRIYPSKIYKKGTNYFNYSIGGGGDKRNIGFTWKRS